MAQEILCIGPVLDSVDPALNLPDKVPPCSLCYTLGDRQSTKSQRLFQIFLKSLNLFGCVWSQLWHVGSLLKEFYLFIFGHAGSFLLCRLFSGCSERGLLSSRGTQASHGGGFSCWGAAALGHRLQQLWRMGSVVVFAGLLGTGSIAVVPGLSCSEAYGIFLDQGLISCIGRQILYY